MPLPHIATSLAESPATAVPLVFAAGVLTSMMPCIYPMIPITAAVVGGPSASRSRGAHRNALWRHQHQPVAAHRHGQSAIERIGNEPGLSTPSRQQFDFERSPNGAMMLDSPQHVIAKILYEHSIFGHECALIQFTIGTIPHDKVLRCIELYCTTVVPPVKDALGGNTAG